MTRWGLSDRPSSDFLEKIEMFNVPVKFDGVVGLADKQSDLTEDFKGPS